MSLIRLRSAILGRHEVLRQVADGAQATLLILPVLARSFLIGRFNPSFVSDLVQVQSARLLDVNHGRSLLLGIWIDPRRVRSHPLHEAHFKQVLDLTLFDGVELLLFLLSDLVFEI